LAHIASDGADTWVITTPTRVEVLDRMVQAIERWNLKLERNINYRSFEPILGLIKCYDTPACQHWAVWALANLTQVSKPLIH
jgi:Zyg-11 protein homolog